MMNKTKERSYLKKNTFRKLLINKLEVQYVFTYYMQQV